MQTPHVGSIVAGLAWSPATTWRAHRDGDLPGLRLCQRWRPGPASGAGRVLLSVNEYRPHRLTDVLAIARLTVALVEEVLAFDDAVGITGAYEPRRRITYSLSVWRGEQALKEFTTAPAHARIMREYRARGYLRHLHWWGEHHSVGASMAEATRRLDLGEGRRVGVARDRWARADQARLATLEVTPAAPIWRRS